MTKKLSLTPGILVFQASFSAFLRIKNAKNNEKKNDIVLIVFFLNFLIMFFDSFLPKTLVKYGF